jgi:uncharacterized membrane protein
MESMPASGNNTPRAQAFQTNRTFVLFTCTKWCIVSFRAALFKDCLDDILQGLIAYQVSGREDKRIFRKERGNLVGQILPELH